MLPVTGGGQAATDSAGFVPDTTAPTVTPNANLTVYSSDPTGATVTYVAPVATDTQDPNPTVSCTPASGTKFKIGTTTVTCTATDANGNADADVVQRDGPVRDARPTATSTAPCRPTLSLTLGPGGDVRRVHARRQGPRLHGVDARPP